MTKEDRLKEIISRKGWGDTEVLFKLQAKSLSIEGTIENLGWGEFVFQVLHEKKRKRLFWAENIAFIDIEQTESDDGKEGRSIKEIVCAVTLDSVKFED